MGRPGDDYLLSPSILNLVNDYTLVLRIHHENENRRQAQSYLRKCLGKKGFFFQKQKYSAGSSINQLIKS